jgi:hypothetical protein
MTVPFGSILGLHAIGLLVTALSGVAGSKNGMLFGLLIIMVSDAILVMADWHDKRNGRASE